MLVALWMAGVVAVMTAHADWTTRLWVGGAALVLYCAFLSACVCRTVRARAESPKRAESLPCLRDSRPGTGDSDNGYPNRV